MKVVKGLVLAGALMVASAMPAAAQEIGAGVTFLGDEGGTGFIVDYSSPMQSSAGGHQLHWVGDLSWNHKGIDGFGTDISFNTLLVQGGVRILGPLGDKLTWHGQVLLGLAHRSGSFDDVLGVCDVVDCSASDNDFVVTPGGAIQYQLAGGNAVRAQLDFPIADGSTTRFSVMYVWRKK